MSEKKPLEEVKSSFDAALQQILQHVPPKNGLELRALITALGLLGKNFLTKGQSEKLTSAFEGPLGKIYKEADNAKKLKGTEPSLQHTPSPSTEPPKPKR